MGIATSVNVPNVKPTEGGPHTYDAACLSFHDFAGDGCIMFALRTKQFVQLEFVNSMMNEPRIMVPSSQPSLLSGIVCSEKKACASPA